MQSKIQLFLLTPNYTRTIILSNENSPTLMYSELLSYYYTFLLFLKAMSKHYILYIFL